MNGEMEGPARIPQLEKARVPAPPSWGPFISLAERVMMNIVPVAEGTMAFIYTGSSPGDCLFLDGVDYIEEHTEGFLTPLHEICHHIVAKNLGKDGRENFDSDMDDEISACDSQITWALANLGPSEAVKIAEFVNYRAASEGETIRNSILKGQEEWKKFGLPQELDEVQLQALAKAWGRKDPDCDWEEKEKKRRSARFA